MLIEAMYRCYNDNSDEFVDEEQVTFKKNNFD